MVHFLVTGLTGLVLSRLKTFTMKKFSFYLTALAFFFTSMQFQYVDFKSQWKGQS